MESSVERLDIGEITNSNIPRDKKTYEFVGKIYRYDDWEKHGGPKEFHFNLKGNYNIDLIKEMTSQDFRHEFLRKFLYVQEHELEGRFIGQFKYYPEENFASKFLKGLVPDLLRGFEVSDYELPFIPRDFS